jgi:pimeloyl-ACP methyl ester carboxylesterase
MAEPSEFSIDIGDVELAVLEWPGEGDPILLLHATGFHSRCWNAVVRHLPGRHVYAADLRFHGASGSIGEVSWSVLSQDIRLLVERLDLQRVTGAGHSIGGYLMTRVAAAQPERFRHLLLIDPVIAAPDQYRPGRAFNSGIAPHDHPVSRRKNRWQDAGEMYRRFRRRKPFASWQDEVLHDYCDYALRPADEVGWLSLACDPLNEAAIYVRQAGNEVIFEELPLLSMPVTLLRAPPLEPLSGDMSGSPTWPELAQQIPNCREMYLPKNSHFIPMEDPVLVARCIREAQDMLF